MVGFGLTPLALGLFAAGLVMAVPAFFHARQIYFMLGWDALVAACGGVGCGDASPP